MTLTTPDPHGYLTAYCRGYIEALYGNHANWGDILEDLYHWYADDICINFVRSEARKYQVEVVAYLGVKLEDQTIIGLYQFTIDPNTGRVTCERSVL